MNTVWFAVPAALIGAASFGMSGAMQHRAARTTRGSGHRRGHAIADLVKHRLWLLSLLCTGLAVVMQWLALSLGPLIVVQSLLVSSLLFGVLGSSALRRTRPSGIVVAGAMLCIAGLAGFLAIARPVPGDDRPTPAGVIPLAAFLVLVVIACLLFARRRTGRTKVLALAGATGVLYGITAGLAKLATGDLTHGVGVALSDWPLYCVLVAGPAGFVLNQSAFRAGVAVAPALAMIVSLEPLVGIAIGVLWLGEKLAAGPFAVLGELFAVLVLFGGVTVLSKFSPQATSPREEKKPPRVQ